MKTKGLILTCLMAYVCCLSANAGKIVTDSIMSKVLNAQVKFNVYLPTGFDVKNVDKKYPIVYLLHGLSDTYDGWKTKGNMQLVADELVESGEIREMIIVMPNAGGPDIRNDWNGYFNMPGWNYEDFFFQELVPTVENKYNVYGDKGHRAVMGLSMGGGGSIVYAQRHPELFSSAYGMSAWLDNGDSQVNGGIKDVEKNKFYYVSKAVTEHSALKYVENADEATKEKLRTVKWFLDCGDDDFLFELSVKLHLLMRDAKIKNELRIRNGVHNWEYWHTALRMSLPFASRNFDK